MLSDSLVVEGVESLGPADAAAAAADTDTAAAVAVALASHHERASSRFDFCVRNTTDVVPDVSGRRCCSAADLSKTCLLPKSASFVLRITGPFAPHLDSHCHQGGIERHVKCQI